MKNKFGALLPIVLLLAIIIGSVPTYAAEAVNGLDFHPLGYYESAAMRVKLPSTFEATVCLPKDLSDRGGVIIGNYSGEKIPLFNFEIHKSGRPRIYINDEALTNYDVIFDKVNLLTGKPTHVAITLDHTSGKWSCYVDGVLKQTVNKTVPAQFYLTTSLRLGGDFRAENAQYFKGTLIDLTLYEDIRTVTEIAKDASGGELDKDNLLCALDMSENEIGKYPATIACSAGTRYKFKYFSEWIAELPEPEDYAYSFAVLGDIQTLTHSYPDELNGLYEWIRDNAEAKKIKFAIGLGDITEKNVAKEYLRVIEAYKKIDGVVPFSIIRGNHDRSGKSSELYDAYITMAKYGDEITGSYDTSMRDTYKIMQIGEVKYLFMNLDFLLRDSVLAWANHIISQNPDCRVIVSTHIYMSATGTYYKATGDNSLESKYFCENNGEGLWDKLLRKHENIVMLICGHNPTDDIYYRTKTGDHGNKVTEILIDPQTTDKNYGGTGLVAMFYFSEDGRKVDVQYYSTAKDAFFKSNNQFTLKLDVRADDYKTPESTAVPDTTTAPDTSAAPDTTTPPAEGGCGAVIGGGVVSVVAMLGFAWVSKRR